MAEQRILDFRQEHPQLKPLTGQYWDTAEAYECVACGDLLDWEDKDKDVRHLFLHVKCLLLEHQAMIQCLKQYVLWFSA